MRVNTQAITRHNTDFYKMILYSPTLSKTMRLDEDCYYIMKYS